VAAGKRIRELRLPQGALVVSVLRENQTFIPDGEYQIRGGDHIVVIARIDFIERVQTLFTAAA
jgi:trk system potassium uptake protein TrkA